MKRLILIWTGFMMAIAMISSLVLLRNSVPFYWGNTLIEQKVKDFLERSDEFNCLFIGSSKIYRHVDVQLFDQLTGMRSYNMGCGGMYYLETHFILEHLLQHHPKPDQLLVFQQSDNPYSFRKANLHTIRSKYFMDLKRMKMGFTHFWSKGRQRQAAFHLISFVENLFCLGMGFEVATYHFQSKSQLQKEVKAQNGFYPLDQREAYERAHPKEKKQRTKSKPYVPDENNPFVDADVMIRLTTPKELRLNSQANHKTRFYQIDPIVLQPEHYYNHGHFNEKGAEIFTRKLAASFLKLNIDH